jgi:hypothetical protein
MSLFTWLQSVISVSRTPHSTHSTSKATGRSHTESSLYGKSASQITSELARRGDGSLPRGVTRTNQKAYWQGRNTERNIDKGTTKD